MSTAAGLVQNRGATSTHSATHLCSSVLSTQPPWQSENPTLTQSHLHIHQHKAVNYQELLLGVCSPWLPLAMHHEPHSPPMPLPRALQRPAKAPAEPVVTARRNRGSCPPAPEESENLQVRVGQTLTFMFVPFAGHRGRPVFQLLCWMGRHRPKCESSRVTVLSDVGLVFWRLFQVLRRSM